MKGITFGSYHSYNDLKLLLNNKEIGSPAVKVEKIDIEGFLLCPICYFICVRL